MIHFHSVVFEKMQHPKTVSPRDLNLAARKKAGATERMCPRETAAALPKAMLMRKSRNRGVFFCNELIYFSDLA